MKAKFTQHKANFEAQSATDDKRLGELQHWFSEYSTLPESEEKRMRDCISFFASVIKNREHWTLRCQEAFDAAMGSESELDQD